MRIFWQHLERADGPTMVRETVLYRRGLVRAPGPNFAQGLTSVDLGIPVYDRALEQHECYCAALEQCGLELIRLAPDSRYPDGTFVEDAAVVTERGAILTRPGAISRLGEVQTIGSALSQFYSPLHSIHEPATIDGGDVCQAANHFFIGISRRTNEPGAEQLGRLLSSFGYTSTFIDIRNLPGILHLKSGLAYLGENRLVVVEALANRAEFQRYDLLVVNAGEEYWANCVSLNKHVLVVSGYPALTERLQQLGYQTIALEMSEFQKMDGGLSCLSLRF